MSYCRDGELRVVLLSALVLLVGVLLSACGDPVDDCVQQFPRSNSELGADDAQVSAVLADCEVDGADCDQSEWISLAAAICAAREHGLASGVGEFASDLVYHYGHQRVVWNIRSVLYEGSDGLRGGSDVALDANNGRLLRRGTWATEATAEQTGTEQDAGDQ